MSRSYKKTPVCKDGNTSKKIGKKFANKKVRRTGFLSGKSKRFRKVYETWNVCDYRFFEPKDPNMKDKSEINHWKKWYLRK